MSTLILELRSRDSAYVEQLEYSLSFADPVITDFDIDVKEGRLTLTLANGADGGEVARKVSVLIDRYVQDARAPDRVYFSQSRELTSRNVWTELLERRWVTEVGEGHVILRGDAALLVKVIDAVAVRDFAAAFDAETELFPVTISCETLDRSNHFTSFPEHVDFVAHLRPDVDVLHEFSSNCEADGWSAAAHDGRMSRPDFAVSPSCCYHCYGGMEGWDVELPGRCVTAVLNCHRYEAGNHRTLTRLRSFTMREVIWIGHPRYVMESRAQADEMIVDWARRWELDCAYEVANDMFFAANYAVRAPFQRQQDAKKELRASIPEESSKISVFSSNFHSTTFGKAFGISAGGRPAASGCVAWGLERFAFAVMAQFGLERSGWPQGLLDDLRLVP